MFMMEFHFRCPVVTLLHVFTTYCIRHDNNIIILCRLYDMRRHIEIGTLLQQEGSIVSLIDIH